MPVLNRQRHDQPPWLTYARLLRESHTLISQGKGDTDQAEALADQMDEPWYAMTTDEQQRMRGLSADLNALLSGGSAHIEMSSDQLAAWREQAKEAYLQSNLGNVDQVLAFLRKPSPATIPSSLILFLRARAWEKLGDLETALLFMKEAERDDTGLTVCVLHLLRQLNKPQEAKTYAERIIDRQDASPEELYMAACTLLWPTRQQSAQDASQDLERIVNVLQRSQTRFLSMPTTERDIPNLDALIAFATGLCQERLGKPTAAVKTYTTALVNHPKDTDLLVARGLTKYLQDRKQGLDDFEKAVRFRSNLVWPYYILARHALQHGAYGDAHRLALAATNCTGPPPILAEVYETIAITLTYLGQSHDWVKDNFDKALALDPTNERIRRNHALALANEPRPAEARPWWRKLKVDTVDVGRLQEIRNAEFASKLTDLGDQYERQISDRQVAMAA